MRGEERVIADDDMIHASSGRDATARNVGEVVWLEHDDARRRRPLENGGGKRVLRLSLRQGRHLDDIALGHAWRGPNIAHRRLANRQGPGLVEGHGIDAPQCLEVTTSLDDGAFPSGKPNRTQNRERSACSNPAGTRDDDHGDRGAHVPRERERDEGADQREVDEIARVTIRGLLDRRARLLGPFDGLDDLAEAGIAADTLRDHLEQA